MGVQNESEVMGVVFLAIGDNSYWLPPVIEYLQNAYLMGDWAHSLSSAFGLSVYF